jgi:hypothetical protein
MNLNSYEAAGRAEFLRLGLTDPVVLSIAETDISVLTADLGLYSAACKAGYCSINFNHVRDH